MAARDDAVLSEPHMREDITAERLDQREALTRTSPRRERDTSRPFGEAGQDCLDHVQALENLVDPHPHSRVDVALAPRGNLEDEILVRRIGMIAPDVEIAPRRATDHAARAEAKGLIGPQDTGRDGSFLQRGGIIVEPHEFGESRVDLAHEGEDRVGSFCSEIFGDAARNDCAHHQPGAEGRSSGAQSPLSQDATMGKHQRKGGVIADGADVAEMIGEALNLSHETAQRMSAGGRFDPERRLNRAGERDAVGDCRIAADASSERRAAIEALAAHERVDPFVYIAEPLLEPHDRLAGGMKPEMAGFDDPSVDRAHRNLMQAVAISSEKGVGVWRAVMRDRPSHGMAHEPAAVIEPAPVVRRFVRNKTEEIAGRAFKAASGSVMRRHGGERAVVTGDVDERKRAGSVAQSHPHPALVAPEADERRVAGSEPARGVAPKGFAIGSGRQA
jgi:hypothetical protein